MAKHSQLEDCSKFLEETNLFTEGTKKKIERFVRTVERGCFDEFLVLFARNIREDDLFKICIYLRSYGIFDQADQERIFNDLVFCTPERKASELLTEIGKRGHHVYWHLAHALKTRQTPMFNFFHGGDFQCCVCREVEEREREERLAEMENVEKKFVTKFRALREKVEDKCTTVKKRAEEKIRNRALARTSSDEQASMQDKDDDLEPEDEESTISEGSYLEDREPDNEGNTKAKDLEKVLDSTLTMIKTFVGKVEEKCSTAVKKRRKRFSRPLSRQYRATTSVHVHEPQTVDSEDLPTALAAETNRTKQGKENNSVAKERTLIQRKRAYKIAFVTLSAVTMFTFYPLPAFDFLFLFIYCNVLILLITF